VGSQGRITLMPTLLSVEGLTIDFEDNSRLSTRDDSRYDEEEI
jgi:hypothetical protein